MLEVIDNFVPLNIVEDLQKTMLTGSFPWYFLEDITGNGIQKRPAMMHYFRTTDNYQSDYISILDPITNLFRFSFGNDYKMAQARSFLQFPLGYKEDSPDSPHIDFNYKHLVLLYYVKDSDGDTILYDNTSITENSSLTEMLRVTPSAGKAIIFDGEHYHTAMQPVNNTRCVINFNFYKD